MFLPCCIQFFSTWESKNGFVCPAEEEKMIFLSRQKKIICYASRKKKVYFASVKFDKMNVFPYRTRFFFYQGVKNRFVCPEEGKKMIFLSPQKKIICYTPREKKVYFASVKFAWDEQSDGKKHPSKINVIHVLHTIFFHLEVKKWICFPRRRQKNALFDPLVEKKIYFTSKKKLLNKHNLTNGHFFSRSEKRTGTCNGFLAIKDEKLAWQ